MQFTWPLPLRDSVSHRKVRYIPSRLALAQESFSEERKTVSRAISNFHSKTTSTAAKQSALMKHCRCLKCCADNSLAEPLASFPRQAGMLYKHSHTAPKGAHQAPGNRDKLLSEDKGQEHNQHKR